MMLATVEVASERMDEVSTPSSLTLVEMFKQGIFSKLPTENPTLVASLTTLFLSFTDSRRLSTNSTGFSYSIVIIDEFPKIPLFALE